MIKDGWYGPIKFTQQGRMNFENNKCETQHGVYELQKEEFKITRDGKSFAPITWHCYFNGVLIGAGATEQVAQLVAEQHAKTHVPSNVWGRGRWMSVKFPPRKEDANSDNCVLWGVRSRDGGIVHSVIDHWTTKGVWTHWIYVPSIPQLTENDKHE